jgi:hypothetical protein
MAGKAYPSEALLGLNNKSGKRSMRCQSNSEHCHFIRIPHDVYEQYAFCQKRDLTAVINESMPLVIPGFKEITKAKKLNLVNNFEEVTFHSHGHILEREDHVSNYVYWVLEGEMLVYKKIDVQFETEIMNNQKVLEEVLSVCGVHPLEMFYHPPGKTGTNLGLCLGAF